ncbi:unnamed protein product, partial [marine sediment metagenome]
LCRECSEALTFVARSKGQIDYKTLMAKYTSFLTTSGYSAAEVTNKFEFPRKTLDLLYPYSCYMGLPASRLDFTIWASLLHLYITQGAYIPKGTSHQMCAAIDTRIRELGGQTEYNSLLILLLGMLSFLISFSKNSYIACGPQMKNVFPSIGPAYFLINSAVMKPEGPLQFSLGSLQMFTTLILSGPHGNMYFDDLRDSNEI